MSKAVLVRIDDRLIHGQIIEGWLKAVRADHILVVSDAAAQDEFQKALMKMAVPSDTTVSILGISEAVAFLSRARLGLERVMVLLPGPREALELATRGVDFESINVGGMHYVQGKRQVMKAVSMSPEDQEIFLTLAKRGIALEGRALPTDTAVNISELLKSHG